MGMYQYVLPPKNIRQTGSEPLLLGISGKAYYSVEMKADAKDPQTASAVILVKERLEALTGGTADGSTGNIVITLETATPPAAMKNAAQGYSIISDDNGITLTGYGTAGLYYAAVTFTQYLALKGNRITFPRMVLTDSPDLATRGHFMESRFGSNLMTLDDWKHVVDNMAEMKMNQLVISVYGCWCVQYDNRVSEYLYIPVKAYPKLKTPVITRYFSPSNGWKDYETLPPMFEKDFFGELAAYGKTKAVTVLPLFNSYGHNTLIPAQYPEVSAVDEKGLPSKAGFCTSNPETYKLLFTIYDEMIDRYLKPNGIDSFHIGMDEVSEGIALNAEDICRVRSAWCRCPECSKKSRIELYMDHAVKLIAHLKERGMKNIYMYNDMLKYAGSSAAGEQTDARRFADMLRKNGLDKVTVMDCWTYSESYENLSFKSTLPGLGLRRTVKPWDGYYHWTLLTHPLNNIYLMAKMAHDEDAEGMQSYSAWDESYQRNHTAQASYAWNFEGTGSPDKFRADYAAFFGGDCAETAERAFHALESSVKQSGAEYSFMLSTLSYYFYSYVRGDVPYPRRFPGEAMARLLADRRAGEAMLSDIEMSAAEACSLFGQLASDVSADYIRAARFAYEAENYLCLVRDYKALLEMHDLSASLPDPDAVKKICRLSAERKKARLALMTVFEHTKEHFLLASHMRNHTIFMQYFADLEGYLNSTPADKVKLDFTDNTHFSSEAFMRLR